MNEKEWLLLIQVACSDFANHKCKAENLWEKVACIESAPWLEILSYTFRTASIMYVYISPVEKVDNSIQLISWDCLLI